MKLFVFKLLVMIVVHDSFNFYGGKLLKFYINKKLYKFL
jgi:hypothetical protein